MCVGCFPALFVWFPEAFGWTVVSVTTQVVGLRGPSVDTAGLLLC